MKFLRPRGPLEYSPKQKQKRTFVSSLLSMSDYKRIGLGLTLKKAMNEVFRRENIKRNKRRRNTFATVLIGEYSAKRSREFGNFADMFGASCDNLDILLKGSGKEKKQWIYQDFCRDFYTSALVWVLELEREDDTICHQFRKAAEAAGHLCLSLDEAKKCGNSSGHSDFCHVYFGSGENRACNDDINFLGRIRIFENSGEIIIKITNQKKTEEQREKVASGGDAFSLANGRMKDFILEDMIAQPNEKASKRISVIICTYRRGEKFADTLSTVINQSMDKKDYEIIVVDNSPLTESARECVEAVSAEYALNGDFIKHIGEPRKGLSYARNCGIRNSDGEYLLFLDDDASADDNLLEVVCRGFDEHPRAGIVGGQVILDIPEPAPEVVIEGYENIWSQFLIPGKKFRRAKGQFEFPYGANFAVRKELLLKTGGFRLNYGRVGNNYDGGEEMVVAFLIRKLGYYIGLEPRAEVMHNVAESRYNHEHVKKTIRAGIFNCYRFFTDMYSDKGWTKKYVTKQIEIVEKEIKLFKNKKAKPIDIFYKECYLETWKELLNKMD